MESAVATSDISHGAKYDAAGSPMVGGTTRRRWRGVTAEVRQHRGIEATEFIQPVTEVAIVSAGTSTIERRGDQRTQLFTAHPGSFCICPGGTPIEFLRQVRGSVEVLHLYVEPHGFAPSQASRRDGLDWPYRGGLHDPLVAQLGLVMIQEMREESPGGELLLDAMSGALIARISQQQARGKVVDRDVKSGLDSRRLERVKDFLSSRIESPVSLDDIAAMACLSRHHFVRAFRLSTSKTPCRYLGDLRIERAKLLLMQQVASVDDIAARLQFANSANFARAFRRSTGLSPSEYRLTTGSRWECGSTHGYRVTA